MLRLVNKIVDDLDHVFLLNYVISGKSIKHRLNLIASDVKSIFNIDDVEVKKNLFRRLSLIMSMSMIIEIAVNLYRHDEDMIKLILLTVSLTLSFFIYIEFYIDFFIVIYMIFAVILSYYLHNMIDISVIILLIGVIYLWSKFISNSRFMPK